MWAQVTWVVGDSAFVPPPMVMWIFGQEQILTSVSFASQHPNETGLEVSYRLSFYSDTAGTVESDTPVVSRISEPTSRIRAASPLSRHSKPALGTAPTCLTLPEAESSMSPLR